MCELEEHMLTTNPTHHTTDQSQAGHTRALACRFPLSLLITTTTAAPPAHTTPTSQPSSVHRKMVSWEFGVIVASIVLMPCLAGYIFWRTSDQYRVRQKKIELGYPVKV
jgi:hypothetical protein